MSESKAVNVLVIMASPRAKYAIETLPEHIVKQYRFFFQGDHPSAAAAPFTSLQDYLDDAKKAVIKNNIKIVLSSSEIAALVHAALVKEYPFLRGPSVESVFLASNKYYMRCLLDPNPIPFTCLDLSELTLDQACEQALQKVGIPAFFKPCIGSGSEAVASVISSKDLMEAALSYFHRISAETMLYLVDAKYLIPFFSKNIDVAKYPLATRPTAIIEKHMGEVSRVNADGYVFNGSIFHWVISDNLYCKSKPRCLLGTAVPTTLSESTQQHVWKLFDAVVTRMIGFGFDNSFVNVEVFVLDSREVKLMEVNPRRGGSVGLTSQEVFENGDTTTAILMLAEGAKPLTPVPNGRHALYSYIRTCGSGKARELYNYSFTSPGLVPENDPDRFLDGSGESGIILGRICLSGDSREEVLDQYKAICCNTLIKPEFSVWKW